MAATTDDERDPIDRELGDLVRAEEHLRWVQERRRRHELRRQADESATLLGALRSLAVAGRTVAISTSSGTHPPSAIVELGTDHVVLRSGDDVRVVPVGAIAAVRALASTGEAPARLAAAAVPLDLAERLAELAVLRQRVHVDAGATARTLVGRLRQASREILVVETDDGLDALVSIDAVTAVGLGNGPHSSASPPLSAEPTTSG